MRRVELAIIGGGPAGLAAAIEAARVGIDAIVLERREGVIDKACGEGLMPAALDTLDALGVEVPVGRPFRGVTYRDATDETLVATGSFSGRAGLGVRRTDLHSSLLKRANSVEFEAMTRRVSGLDVRDSSVLINDEVEAQWVIGADGLHSKVRRASGLECTRESSIRFGIRRHYRIAPWTDRVEVHWSARGEAYVTPIADDLVGVAFLYEPPARFEALMDYFPVLQARLSGASPVTEARGAGTFSQRARAVRNGRVLLVGDAAGYVDALTGEGIAIAMMSAREAVAAIAEGRPETYPDRYRAVTRRWEWATRGLLAMTRPAWVHRPLIRLLGAFPPVFDLALGVLGGAENDAQT